MERVQRLSQAQITELSGIINSNQSSFAAGKKAQIILMLNGRIKTEEIQMLTGYSRRHLFTMRKAYLTQGIEAIKDKPRKPQPLLTREQRDETLDALKNKKPSDFGYGTDFWTTNILAYHIKKEYAVDYKSKTSIRLLFKKAEFSYHKPEKKYQRRDEKEVAQWEKDTKPILEEAWKDPNTVILVEDEMLLSTQTTVQKIWLPRGEYPKIDVATKRENRSLYGFLNIKTGTEYAFKTLWQNMYITESILKKIRKLFPGKKILLIWDQAGWHKGSVVKKYIEKTKGEIKTICFPAGAPDLNPQEHVWKAGRSNVTHNNFIENIDKATDQFVNFLNTKKFTYALLGLSANLE
jgi:transposase